MLRPLLSLRRSHPRIGILIERGMVSIYRDGLYRDTLRIDVKPLLDRKQWVEACHTIFASAQEDDRRSSLTVLVDASLAPAIPVDARALRGETDAWREFATHKMSILLGSEYSNYYAIRAERFQSASSWVCAMPADLLDALKLGVLPSTRLSIQPVLPWVASNMIRIGSSSASQSWSVVTRQSVQLISADSTTLSVASPRWRASDSDSDHPESNETLNLTAFRFRSDQGNGNADSSAVPIAERTLTTDGFLIDQLLVQAPMATS